MKALIWTLTALVALVWSGGALAVAELTDWVARTLAGGVSVDVAVAATPWPVPAWLAPWVDPGWVQAAQHGLATLLTWLSDGGPLLGTLVGWLVPLVWVAWGLGLAALLALAGVLHWLVGRTPRAPAIVAA